jgi:opacity protein-like surface antigen
MNFLKKACIALLFLLPASGSSLLADRYYQDDRCCGTSCQSYDCSCEPLVPCAWDVQIQAGVAPILWTHRDQISGLDCALAPALDPLISIIQFPCFSKLFKIPWTIGGQIGYEFNENIRVYAEVNYLQAKGKKDVTITSDVLPNIGVNSAFVFNFSKYRLVDFYLGFRYYFDRWCDLVSLFIGAKAGFTHYDKTNLNFSISIPATATPATSFTGFEIFQRTTKPSGGLEIGLDFCLGCNWYLALTGGFVASCGPRVNFDFISAPLLFRNIFFGNVGPEIRFPVTLAIRHAF